MTFEAETQIREIIDMSEKPIDPLGKLLETVTKDCGAPFEPEGLALLRELKGTEPARFERVRNIFKKQGVRVGQLDKLLTRAEAQEDSTHASLHWPEDEVWPSAVAGAELLDDIATGIRRYLVARELQTCAIALWTVFAHTLDAWSTSPRLVFVSPEKRCGKTLSLSIVQQLVPKPLFASNVTPAAVFRTIEVAQPTLLIDELDTFLSHNDELRGVLNSGHGREGSFVLRLVGEDHTPTKFSTWAPIVIAKIGKLPDTLHDRSIVIELRRKRREDRAERYRNDRTKQFEVLRRQIARWSEDNLETLRQWDGPTPGALHDRAADNWRPLLAIADTAGGRWPSFARKAALAISSAEDPRSPGVLLLQDLKAMFAASETDRLSTADILESLHDKDDRPWPEWKRGKPITPRQLSKLLEEFDIRPTTVRFNSSKAAKGYQKASFKDAFSRYIPSQSVTPLQLKETAAFSESISVTSDANVTATNVPNPSISNTCNVVTDKAGEVGEDTHNTGEWSAEI